MLTYKAFIQPVISYGAPVWYPNASASSIKKLQTVQNAALRTVTGNHSNAPWKHLHAETETLLVADHLDLLSSQFLAGAKRSAHPSFATVSTPSQPRQVKQTLHSKCADKVAPLLREGVLPIANFKRAISALHTSIVSQVAPSINQNSLLGAQCPAISKTEKSLPRPFRRVLSQLRGGCCSSLMDYQNLLDRSVDDLCPECRVVTHSSSHLFSCTAAPTNLSIIDLWNRPRDVAEHLSTLQSFSHLPPLPPLNLPLPRPPPEPPP